MPLVKFFHCVSFLKAAAPIFFFIFFLPFQLPYSHSSSFLLWIVPLSFCLSCPVPLLLLCPVSQFYFNHASLWVFSYFSPVICKFPLFLFMFPALATIHPFPSQTLFLFSALFSTPAEVIYWVDGLRFSCMQITLKSPPISDHAPGPG